MIEIKKVSKRFDKIAAVSDVSLSIEQGQVFGLLGTNGAGKSTLLPNDGRGVKARGRRDSD